MAQLSPLSGLCKVPYRETKEFYTEIEMISRLHHRNLVSLVGYCDEKDEQGYVDPEKSDAYSLGVVFLELLTGMQPISHGRDIVREVNAACQSGMMFSVIDKSMGPYPSDCVKKFMALALRCSLDDTKDRPLMLEVVRELESILVMLPESDSATLEMNINMTSYSGTSVGSGQTSSNLYDRSSPYVTMDIPGSDIVSGGIHTI